jgi:hypothetical protein
VLDGENFINTINVYINLYPNANSLLSCPVCITSFGVYQVGGFEFTSKAGPSLTAVGGA